MASEIQSRLDEETLLGITEHINTDFRFKGIIKQRQEDFHVHEVNIDGEILTLTELLSIHTIREEFDRQRRSESGEGVLCLNYTIPQSVSCDLINNYCFSQENIEVLNVFIRETVLYASEFSQRTNEHSITGQNNESKKFPATTCEGHLNGTQPQPFECCPPLLNLKGINKLSIDCPLMKSEANRTNVENINPDRLSTVNQSPWPPHCYILQTPQDQHANSESLNASNEAIPCKRSPQVDHNDPKAIRKKMHQAISKYFPFLLSETVKIDSNILHNNKKQFRESNYTDYNTEKVVPPTGQNELSSTISTLCIRFHPAALHYLFPNKARAKIRFFQKQQKSVSSLSNLECSAGQPPLGNSISDEPNTHEAKKNEKKKRCRNGEILCDERYTFTPSQNSTHANQTRWPKTRPPYLLFHLYKANRDTAEAIQMIANCIHCSPKAFTYAGTKDRRAVTVQGVTAYHISIEQLHQAMLHPRWDPNVKISNLRYTNEKLSLGYLRGNHFQICIRNVSPDAEPTVQHAMRSLQKKGFINYFGSQRFGTRAVKTHHIGSALLQGDFKKSVDLILGILPSEPTDKKKSSNEGQQIDGLTSDCLRDGHNADVIDCLAGTTLESTPHHQQTHINNNHKKENPFTSDTFLNNNARDTQVDNDYNNYDHNSDYQNWQSAYSSGFIELAFKLVPRHLYLERIILKSLTQFPNDYLRALQRLPKNILTLYIHAVQSLIWNHVASYRIKTYGLLPRSGDFIYDSQKNPFPKFLTETFTLTDFEPHEQTQDKITEIHSSEEEKTNCENCIAALQSKTNTIDKCFTNHMPLPIPINLLNKSDIIVVKEEDLKNTDPFSIVLPLPGEGVKYPEYLEEIYEEICQHFLGIKLAQIRSIKSKGLGEYVGGYRLLRMRPRDINYRFIQKAEHNQCLPTDELYLSNPCSGFPSSNTIKLHLVHNQDINNIYEHHYEHDAVVLFSCILPKASYLTMACRELLNN